MKIPAHEFNRQVWWTVTDELGQNLWKDVNSVVKYDVIEQVKSKCHTIVWSTVYPIHLRIKDTLHENYPV